MKRRLAAALVLGVLLPLSATTPVRAGAVIFDNLGPGESYNGSEAYFVGLVSSPLGSFNFATASAFTSSGNYQLGTIAVAAQLESGTNSVTISLDADSGGLPGAVIESFTITGAMPRGGSTSSGDLVTATSVLQPMLTAGTQYWVVLSASNATSAGWNLNSTGDLGPTGSSENGGPFFPRTQTRGALLITAAGSAVPEPSSIVLGGASIVLLVGCIRLRRNERTNVA